MKNIPGFAILFLVVFLISCSMAHSASFYYVDNSVASNGNGTQSSPWKNLSNINWSTISTASKPCTIYVSGGAISQTYAENWAIGASGSGVGNEVIIKRPASAEWPGHGGIVYIPSPSSSFDIGGVHYVIIDGFDMTGVYGGVYLFDGSTYITIRNCIIKDIPAGKSIGGNGADHVTIQNCILGPNITSGGDDPIQVNGNDWIVEKSFITGGAPSIGDQHYDDIQIGNGGSTLNFHIRYNIFREANSAGIAVYADDMSVGENVSTYIYGNIFEFTNSYNNTVNCPGISMSGSTAWVKAYIYNNTFVNFSYPSNPYIGIGVGGTNASNVWDIRNNIFYNSIMDVNQTNGMIISDYNIFYMTYNGAIVTWNDKSYAQSQFAAYKSASGQDAHSLNMNPLLAGVSEALDPNHDLRPTASSPGMNAGVDLGAAYNVGLSMENTKSSWPWSVTTISRPQGSAWDIGAYEYVGTVDTNPPLAPKDIRIR